MTPTHAECLTRIAKELETSTLSCGDKSEDEGSSCYRFDFCSKQALPLKTPAVTCPLWRPILRLKSAVSGPRITSNFGVMVCIFLRHARANLAMTIAARIRQANEHTCILSITYRALHTFRTYRDRVGSRGRRHKQRNNRQL